MCILSESSCLGLLCGEVALLLLGEFVELPRRFSVGCAMHSTTRIVHGMKMNETSWQLHCWRLGYSLTAALP
jgi:hypothetical protein